MFAYAAEPPKEEISHRECIHASYVEAKDGNSDAVIVKELIHCKDGRVIPFLRVIENYQRDYYLTLPRFQTHKDKRSFEKLERLRKFTCSQHELHNKVARSLGKPATNLRMQVLARDPYLYGTDIQTPVLVKRAYRDRWVCDPSPQKVAIYDVETNMNSEEKEIIIAAMSSKNRARQSILEQWIKSTSYKWEGEDKFRADLKATYERLIGPLLAERKIDLEIELVNNPGAAVKRSFDLAHEIQPDYVGIFNIDADIPWSIRALEECGYNLNDVFCDPRVPEKYRAFRYKKGQTSKKQADGSVEPINIHDQWHYCENQASFILADQMLLYKRIRIASPNEPSYGLDAILQRNGLDGKLAFTEADHLEKGEWHEFMQYNYPLEYCVYNLVDVIRCEQLDEKTNDMAMVLGALLKCSEYKSYNSQPKLVADDLHFFGISRGNMIGSTSDQMLTEIDKFTPNLKNWIVTLPSYMMADRPNDIVRDMGPITAYEGECNVVDLQAFRRARQAVHVPYGHQTLVETHVSDVDIVSTYPNLQAGLNIDKETTQTELSSVDGYHEQEWRHAGIDTTAGFVNANMIGQKMLGLPEMDDMLAAFLEDNPEFKDQDAA